MEGEKKNVFRDRQFVTGLVIGIIVVVVVGLIIWAAVSSSDGKRVQQSGTFDYDNAVQVCQENGKPAVYLFSTTDCPHCVWIKDTFDSTVKKYVDEGKIAAHHYELDTGDDTLTEAVETEVPAEAWQIFQKYNAQGAVPMFVFGCQYTRLGNGYEQQGDLKAEAAEFERVIDELIK